MSNFALICVDSYTNATDSEIRHFFSHFLKNFVPKNMSLTSIADLWHFDLFTKQFPACQWNNGWVFSCVFFKQYRSKGRKLSLSHFSRSLIAYNLATEVFSLCTHPIFSFMICLWEATILILKINEFKVVSTGFWVFCWCEHRIVFYRCWTCVFWTFPILKFYYYGFVHALRNAIHWNFSPLVPFQWNF